VRIKKSFIDNILVGIMVFLALFFILGALTNFLPYKMVVIDNHDPNSMHPTYLQGDIFMLNKVSPSTYQIGDVIVYKPSSGSGLIIHRIIHMEDIDGVRYFVVKGDNYATNYKPDPYGEYNYMINQNQVLGKIILKIPFLGHFSLALQFNQLFRVIVLFTAGGVMLYIFFSDDEKDEKEEFFDVDKKSLNVFKIRLSGFISTPKGKLTLGMGLVIVVMLIPSLFFPGVFYTGDKADTPGLLSVESNNNTYRESQQIGNQQVEWVFYQVTVIFYDSGYPGGRMSSIVTEAFKSGSGDAISHTEYKRIGSIVGVQTYGASVILKMTDLGLSDQTLDVVVTFHFDSGKTQKLTTTIDYTIIGGI